ncbi:unnamed protein product, partial [Prunus brigantina]
MDWKRQEWRNSKIRIDSLRAELQNELQVHEFDGHKVRRLEVDLKKELQQEEEYWKLKSRVQWLHEGDKNTKFFHSKVVVRRRINQLKGLEDHMGTWHREASDIRRIAESYFQELFTSGDPMGAKEILDCVQATVTSQDNLAMSKPVLEAEVVAAVKQLDPIKSPGLDGFTGSFYQKFWSTIGGDILGMVQSFFHSGRMLRKLNHTHIVLIPKLANPRKMTQWRPISLCNVVYKIISKVLTNRLKKVIPHVVSVNQSAFVAERQITDNILVVHEILHSLKIARGADQQFMAMKLDMAKAHDRVEWIFLDAMMGKLGFDSKFRRWIMECVTIVSYSVLINGEPSG